jgi:hypothetical protein
MSIILRLSMQTSLRTVLNYREWRRKIMLLLVRKYNILLENYKPYPAKYNAGDMPAVTLAGRFFDRSPWRRL